MIEFVFLRLKLIPLHAKYIFITFKKLLIKKNLAYHSLHPRHLSRPDSYRDREGLGVIYFFFHSNVLNTIYLVLQI